MPSLHAPLRREREWQYQRAVSAELSAAKLPVAPTGTSALERQLHRKCAAPPLHALHGDAPAVQFEDLAGHVEPDAEPAEPLGVRVLGAIKAVEEPTLGL